MTSGEAGESLRVIATSRADDLSFLGQKAVAESMGDAEYRLVGGNMVRLLQCVYPTPSLVPRATLDADAAAESPTVVTSSVEHLKRLGFEQERANSLVKLVGGGDRVEVNFLLSSHAPRPGRASTEVDGVGMVDSLPEFAFSLAQPPLVVHVSALLMTGEELAYTTKIPTLEGAVVLKAHAWRGRLATRDLLDICSLLEIRDRHLPEPWRLNESRLVGRRRDTAHILHTLRRMKPAALLSGSRGALGRSDLLRLSGLVVKHVSEVAG